MSTSKKDLSGYYVDAYGTSLEIGDKVVCIFKGVYGRVNARKGTVIGFKGTCITVKSLWPGLGSTSTDNIKSVSLVKADWK